MKTFKLQISAHARRTRKGEKAATRRIVENLLGTLEGPKWDQARRIYLLLKDPAPVNETKGPFSGLTRRELAASGTCEPDWF